MAGARLWGRLGRTICVGAVEDGALVCVAHLTAVWHRYGALPGGEHTHGPALGAPGKVQATS